MMHKGYLLLFRYNRGHQGRCGPNNYAEKRITKEVPMDIPAPSPPAFGLSLKGKREQNEDAFLIEELKGALLLAVADGLGGHAAGEVASALAIDIVREMVALQDVERMSGDEVKSLLQHVHSTAHQGVREHGLGSRNGMATTLVSAIISKNRVFIANTGDSRAYIINNSVRFRTRDHSLVQEMVEKGLLDTEAASDHPLSTIVTHTIGTDFGVDLYEQTLIPGEILILSSDGLHDYVRESEMVESAMLNDPREIAQDIVQKALQKSGDNITVVVYMAGR